jgi:putative GTP pyrophosphokinase
MPEQQEDEFLRSTLPKYERLTRVVSTLLENLLRHEGVDFLSITARTKSHASAVEKFRRKSYRDIRQQMTDLSGVRVITYRNSQVQQVSRIIYNSFSVDHRNSLDRSQILGNDKVGYRSVHFVCTLGWMRHNIVEYKDICELPFEIQIRTVLQHAWAELTHDRSYKFSGALPAQIQRKLNLHSGALEIVDNAFDEISQDIEDYEQRLRTDTKEDLRNEAVNSVSLNEYFGRTFTKYKLPISYEYKLDGRCIQELISFGVTTIGELEAMITKEFIRDLKKSILPPSALGFVRRALLYNDFEKALNSNREWSRIIEETRDFLEFKYGKLAMFQMLQRHSIPIQQKIPKSRPKRKTRVTTANETTRGNAAKPRRTRPARGQPELTRDVGLGTTTH